LKFNNFVIYRHHDAPGSAGTKIIQEKVQIPDKRLVVSDYAHRPAGQAGMV
jgi:hypothetical protein